MTVTAADSVELSGISALDKSPSGLFTDPTGAGDAGSLTINTGQLIVKDGANVSTTSQKSSTGQGGALSVTAADSVKLSGTSAFDGSPSGLFAQTLGTGVDAGDAGKLTVVTGKLLVEKGAQIVAGTGDDSKGMGGTLTVDASDSVKLSGTAPDGQNPSGLFARSRGSGSAGSLTVNTGQLAVRDGAQVTVSGVKSGAAGNLGVVARSIHLENEGAIVAETASGQGGDITLQVQDLLLMRNNSRISTTAGAGGDGGNININTKFIVAVPTENSDIKANAFRGQGGKVTINHQGIFGLAVRNLKDLQILLGTEDATELDPINLQSSDITAISQTDLSLSGQVDINSSVVDPSQGLVSLPTELVDAAGLITQGCAIGDRTTESQFSFTGRGGLPENPSETLSSDAVLVDLVTLNPKEENQPSPTVVKNSTSPTPDPIVEAQGWVVGDNGEVVLTASAPTVTPNSSWQNPVNCGISQLMPEG